MTIANGLPTRDEALVELERAFAQLRVSIADERAAIERQLAGANQRLHQLQEELALTDQGRAILTAHLVRLEQLDQAMRRVSEANARLRFA